MGRKLTREQYQKKVDELVGKDYVVVGDYEGSFEKTTMKHLKCGCEWDVTPNNLLYVGSRCPRCSNLERMSNKDFEEKIKELTGDEYTLVSEFENQNTQVILRHNECGKEWAVYPNNFIHKGSRCLHCSGKKRKTGKEFQAELDELFDGEYQLVDKQFRVEKADGSIDEYFGKYYNNSQPVKIKHIIDECGETFEATPLYLLQNRPECPECKDRNFRAKLTRKLGKTFFEEFELLNKYKNDKMRLKIKHKKCGEVFEETPLQLAYGDGECPFCDE
ncbi:MAG: hypothetical protein ACOCQR_00165 [bacterium]